MITALGTGISKEDFDASKLRYGKVILMTDADVDGSHIRTLLLTFFFRHMQELIKRGNVFIAQPPLYSIKKGKSQQYIKDDKEYVKVMVKRAAEGLIVRYGEGAAKLEGADLAKFITGLRDISVLDKLDKRLRDENVTEILPKMDLAKHIDFEGDKKVGSEENREARERAEAHAERAQLQGSREPLRRRAQPLGSALRQLAGRRAPHQLGAGFHSRVPATVFEVQAD